jgi:hypothetical protein
MQQTEARELLKKYLDGNASNDEILLLESWYLQFELKELPAINEVEGGKQLDKIRSIIITHSDKVKGKTILLWPRIAVAASVLFVLSVSGYFLLRKATVKQQVAVTQMHDLAPGSNKAILTLANGKQIVLTGAQNGKLATQGNTAINKTADGQVVYDATAANTTAELIYNTMSTPRGGQYHLTLADGTDVWLNAASSIKYPTAFTGNSREVEITGEAYFEVAHNKAMPFRVTSKGQTIEVLGTRFNVNAYNDEPVMKTTLFEGSVKIGKDKQTVMLKPGQQAIIVNNSNASAIEVMNNADTDQVLAWKNGEFSFNETDLQTVMRQIGRWYDVDIEYDGRIPVDHLSGTFSRNMNASKALTLLKFTGINFKIEGRKIIVK